MQQEVYGEVVQGEIVGVVQPAPVIPTATPVTTQPGFSSEVELGAPAPRRAIERMLVSAFGFVDVDAERQSGVAVAAALPALLLVLVVAHKLILAEDRNVEVARVGLPVRLGVRAREASSRPQSAADPRGFKNQEKT